MTSRRSWPRSRRAASAPTSSRAASGRSPTGRSSRTIGSRSRASARPTPTSGPPSGPLRPGRPLLLGRPRIGRGGGPTADGPAGRARTGDAAALDVLVRLNPDVTPETLAGPGRRRRGSKFGMTETEIDRRRRVADGEPDGPLRSARGPPPRRLAARCRGCVARRRPARAGGRRPAGAARSPTFDTLDVGGGFPVLPLDEPAPTPERFARELPALLDAVPADRRPARLAIEPGRFLVARSGWLVAGSSTSASAAAARSSSMPG